MSDPLSQYLVWLTSDDFAFKVGHFNVCQALNGLLPNRFIFIQLEFWYLEVTIIETFLILWILSDMK